MAKYARHLTGATTPQTEALPGQVKGKGGGYVFQVDKWKILHRFLTMGSEDGSYYQNERQLTVDNAQNVLACIREDGKRVVEQTFTISDQGRAPKNDPAIFVLALCVAEGNADTKEAALGRLTGICRIGTHLFQFVDSIQTLGCGWSRSLRRSVSNWYLEKEINPLAYQVVKYKQRGGFSHKDVIRLAHPSTDDETLNNVFRWIAQNNKRPAESELLPDIILASEEIQECSRKRAIQLIDDYRLPREVLPTELLNHPDVWEALLPHMGLTALIRNLPKLTNVGIIKPLSHWSGEIVARLTDEQSLRRSRIHPINILIALKTYGAGHSARGDNTWKSNGTIIDALDEAFYASFGNVEATGKRLVIGVDVSASMNGGGWVNGRDMGLPGLSPRIISAAMAMIYVRTEPNTVLTAFSHELIETDIGRRNRLDDVIDQFSKMPFGHTNVSAPMEWAEKRGIEADGFIVLTDCETNHHGSPHPCVVMDQYRKKRVADSKFIVNCMTPNGATAARPDDPLSIDLSGFDSATPQIISEFLKL